MFDHGKKQDERWDLCKRRGSNRERNVYSLYDIWLLFYLLTMYIVRLFFPKTFFHRFCSCPMVQFLFVQATFLSCFFAPKTDSRWKFYLQDGFFIREPIAKCLRGMFNNMSARDWLPYSAGSGDACHSLGNIVYRWNDGFALSDIVHCVIRNTRDVGSKEGPIEPKLQWRTFQSQSVF